MMNFHRWRRALGCVVWFTLLDAVAAAGDTCYFPNGQIARDYNWYKCNYTTSTGFQTCCVPEWGDICMENGLCYWQDRYVYRGACADKSWTDGKCANYCRGGTQADSWMEIKQCSDRGEFCCNTAPFDCCTDGTVLFTLDTKGTKLPISTTNPDATIATGAATTSNNPATDSPAKSVPGQATRLPAARGTTSSVTIGAVAGAVGVTLIIAIVVVVVFCRKRRKAVAGNMFPSPEQASLGQTTLYGSPPGHQGFFPREWIQSMTKRLSSPSLSHSQASSEAQVHEFPAGGESNGQPFYVKPVHEMPA